jgi:GAF domain-containing protein
MVMLSQIRRFLAPPIFEGDEDRTRLAAVLNTLSWMLVALIVIVGVLGLLQVSGLLVILGRDFFSLIFVAAPAVLALLFGAVQFLMRRGRVRPASWLLVSIFWLLMTTIAALVGTGVRAPALGAFVLAVLLAGLLLGWQAGIAFAVLSIMVGFGLLFAEVGGFITVDTTPAPPEQELLPIVFIIASTAFLLYLALRGLNEALENARRASAELEEQRGQLEETVEERTRDLAQRARYLEATSQVARDAASVLELEEVLSRVVTLVSERFGFYHTGIFLLDSRREWALLEAASSEGGQQMLARGHRLRVGEVGIVGLVAARGVHRIALDVGADAVSFDNPDLLQTRSEMALPLQARGEIIGVLDVQSTEPEAFGDADVEVLQTLADQVAVAISNARLFRQAEESLEAERRAYGRLSREAWQTLFHGRPDLGVLRDEQGLSPVGDLWLPEMRTALRTGGVVLGGDGAATVAVPVVVRNQVIGVVDVQKAGDSEEWSQEEIALLQMLVEQLGLAVEGARLYWDTERREARERMAREITARMRETMDMEIVLKTAADEMYRALDLEEVVVRLVADEPSVDRGESP